MVHLSRSSCLTYARPILTEAFDVNQQNGVMENTAGNSQINSNIPQVFGRFSTCTCSSGRGFVDTAEGNRSAARFHIKLKLIWATAQRPAHLVPFFVSVISSPRGSTSVQNTINVSKYKLVA